MSAIIPIAREIISSRSVHISDVDKTKKEQFVCCGCKQKIIPVKTLARKKDWHFRHPPFHDILKCRSTALHDLAVQILVDNNSIRISKDKYINYTQPRTEVVLFSKRSDVTVNYDNEEINFEIFVTHDLDAEKIETYRVNKVKCVKIDLSGRTLLNASPEEIKREVLESYLNKTLFNFESKPVTTPHIIKEINILPYILGAIVFLWLFLFKPFSIKRR